MKNRDESRASVSRRDFLRLAGAGVTALGVGAAAGTTISAAAPNGSPASPEVTPDAGNYNILFILTDQERFFRPGELPVG